MNEAVFSLRVMVFLNETTLQQKRVAFERDINVKSVEGIDFKALWDSLHLLYGTLSIVRFEITPIV